MEELETFGFVKFMKGARQGALPAATTARITFFTVNGQLGSATNDYKKNTLQSVEHFKDLQRTKRKRQSEYAKARRKPSRPSFTEKLEVTQPCSKPSA